MFFPVAGSSLFISRGDRMTPSGGWTEIRSAESLGMPGGEWDMLDVTHMGSSNVEMIKGLLRPRPMEIVLAEDLGDPGQLMLWQAFRSREDFWFRLRFSDAGAAQRPVRQWRALVTALDEAFDQANSAVKMLVQLQLNSEVQRIEGME